MEDPVAGDPVGVVVASVGVVAVVSVEAVVVVSVEVVVVVSVVEGAGRGGEEHPEEHREGEGGEAKVGAEGEENPWLSNREVPDSMTSVWLKRSMLSLSCYAPLSFCL